MRTDNKKWLYGLIPTILGIFILAGVFSLISPAAALAETDTLEITGDGVMHPVTFTREQLEEMEQYQCVYSCINTWPTKKWYVGKGVKLRNLLAAAGMTGEAKLIRFSSQDGYTVTLTVKELLRDKRYRFPGFKAGADGDGHVPGDPAGKVEVEPIVGLVSVEGSDNPEYMNDLNSFLLMLGQRTVTEQTGNLFVKYLNKIEVLTGEPERWDAPRANPPAGTVPAGTMVTLSNLHNDDDKIYYTTDGSTPDMDSPVYNWISSRWWPARADVLGTINHPVGPVNEDTTIKAVTIGPGKLDSEMVTFNYRVEGTEPVDGSSAAPPGPEEPETIAEPGTGAVPGKPRGKIIALTVGQREALVNGASCTLDAAPFINDGAGRTLVPVRFVSEALGAGVAWNHETRQVNITDGEKEIVLTIGSSRVLVNGLQQIIDCAPEIVSGRTLVPLRFVSETLGAKVGYEDVTREITITG